jgi:hypothetical protein
MHYAKTARSVALAAAVCALIGTTTASSADAYGYRRHHGAGLALGIGSLIVGGIIADNYRRHRYYDDHYYRPNYSYGYAPRYYGWRHHNHHRHDRRW